MSLVDLIRRWFVPCPAPLPEPILAREEQTEKALTDVVERRKQTVQEIVNLAALDSEIVTIFDRRRHQRNMIIQ